MTDRERIERMVNQETVYVNWFQGSGGEVFRNDNTLILHEIGECGKDIQRGVYPFSKSGIDKLLSITDSWT